MPQYLSTDPNAGETTQPSSSQYLSGDPQAGDAYAGPDTFGEGFRQSLGETALAAGLGFLRGALKPVLHPIETAKGALGAVETGMRLGGLVLAGPAAPGAGRVLSDAREQAQALGEGARRILSGDPEAGGEAIGMLTTGRIMPTLARVPAGRITSAGWAGTKAGAARLPIVGPPGKAFIGAARESWAQGAPKTAPAPAPAAPTPVSGAKLKLSAPEVAQRLRQEYGSEQAGRMLYGKAGPGQAGLPRKEATAAIKRLAPGESQLPGAAQRAIQQGIQQGNPADVWKYVMRAPNQRARDYFLSLMRGKKTPGAPTTAPAPAPAAPEMGVEHVPLERAMSVSRGELEARMTRLGELAKLLSER